MSVQLSLASSRAHAIAAGVGAFVLASLFFTMTVSQGSAAWVPLVLGASVAVLGHHGFAALTDTLPDARARIALVGAGYGVGFAGVAALFA